MKIEPNKVGAFVKCNLKTASKEEISEIKTALEKFGVLFFRNQDLDSKSYINLAKEFGPLADYPMLKGLSKEFPEITVVERKKTDTGPSFGGPVDTRFHSGYHTDSSYTSSPPRFTMLLAKLVPKGQGNTEFSSQYLAYKNLPENYKKKLENLKGVFSSSGSIAKSRVESELKRGKGNKNSFEAIHPIIKKINNKKSIYCSPGHLIKFVDVGEKEAKELKDFLFNFQVKPEFCFSFEWEPKSLAIWDNRSMLHRATSVSGVDRILHRITIQ